MAGSELSTGAAILYGLIQGITEFLPISSDGHLKLAHRLGVGTMAPNLELPFDVLLHSATLVAIVIGFWRDLLASLKQSPRFYGLMLISMVPVGIAGLLGKRVVEAAGEAFWIIGLCYAFNAILLYVSEEISKRHTQVETEDPSRILGRITLRQAVFVGLLQVLALLPGVSRSGTTISGALLGGMGPRLAVSYSFLVGFPLISAAVAKDALDGGVAELVAAVGVGPLAIALLVTLVSGLAAVAVLRQLARRRMMRGFAVYCGFVAMLCFAFELG
ncbi:MAG: undecaprenyl-diphosphate phosphatase [Deltaproteobacteria bacterium]|nr:undecaprenyl-diphosphate phosphatase [Deltaproteobacteria bacterium]